MKIENHAIFMNIPISCQFPCLTSKSEFRIPLAKKRLSCNSTLCFAHSIFTFLVPLRRSEFGIAFAKTRLPSNITSCFEKKRLEVI